MSFQSPKKSPPHPLHNFSLPQLKWSKNHHRRNNRHRHGGVRALHNPASTPPPPVRSEAPNHSPSHSEEKAPIILRESLQPTLSLGESSTTSPFGRALWTETPNKLRRLRRGGSSSKTPTQGGDPVKPTLTPAIDKKPLVGTQEKRARIIIKLPGKNSQRVNNKNPPEKASMPSLKKSEKKAQSPSKNPNKKASTSSKAEGRANFVKGGAIGGGKKGGGENKGKRKLSIHIPLTPQEIKEDIYSLTGAKPSRKPQRRPNNIQKQLDKIFPGQLPT